MLVNHPESHTHTDHDLTSQGLYAHHKHITFINSYAISSSPKLSINLRRIIMKNTTEKKTTKGLTSERFTKVVYHCLAYSATFLQCVPVVVITFLKYEHVFIILSKTLWDSPDPLYLLCRWWPELQPPLWTSKYWCHWEYSLYW